MRAYLIAWRDGLRRHELGGATIRSGFHNHYDNLLHKIRMSSTVPT